jgi:hypothetical protein
MIQDKVRAAVFWSKRIARVAYVRRLPVVCAALLALYGLVTLLNRDLALGTHPLWRYLTALGLAALFAAACLASGHALLRLVLGRTLRCADHLAISYALGLAIFYAGTCVIGLARCLTVTGCALLPLVMLAASAKPVWRTLRRVRRLRRVFLGRGPSAPRVGWVAVAIGASSLVPLGARWLTTATAGYDSTWYHLVITERYAVAGAIEAFREGWLQGAGPQMASVLYAWAFVLTKSTSLGMVTSGLLEYTFVLSAVLGVVPLARVLLRRSRRLPWAWATIAMFPAWQLYGPQLEADCLVAAFAPALALLTFAAWRSFDPRLLIVWGLLLGAAASIKLTAFTVCAFPTVALGVRGAFLLVRPGPFQRSKVLGAVAAGALAGLFVSSTWWLRNWVFYGNPLYPSLMDVFGGRPWSDSAGTYHREVWLKQLWRVPEGMEGFKQIRTALFTFSYEPHEYPTYNPGRPLFGSLFTLALPILMVSRSAFRSLILYGGVLLGIALWLKIHSQDRYLEALLPWMMAVVAVAGKLSWQAGVLGRAAAIVAVTLQLAWTMPLVFSRFPYSSVSALLALPTVAAWDKAQSASTSAWRAIGRTLPQDAVLLVHESQSRFGVRRRTVTDEIGFQGKLSYIDLGTDAAIYDALRELEVTHVWASTTSRALDSLGSDLAFYAFFARATRTTSTDNVKQMLRTRPPSAAAERLVFIDSCNGLPEPVGLYRLRDLTRFGWQQGNVATPLERVDSAQGLERVEEMLARAEFLVTGASCNQRVVARPHEHFAPLATRGGLKLHLRVSAPIGR